MPATPFTFFAAVEKFAGGFSLSFCIPLHPVSEISSRFPKLQPVYALLLNIDESDLKSRLFTLKAVCVYVCEINCDMMKVM